MVTRISSTSLAQLRADLAHGSTAVVTLKPWYTSARLPVEIVAIQVTTPDGSRLHAALTREHLGHLARLQPWVQP